MQPAAADIIARPAVLLALSIGRFRGSGTAKAAKVHTCHVIVELAAIRSSALRYGAGKLLGSAREFESGAVGEGGS